jgi:hypothetical protein
MPPVTMCSLGKRPCFHQVSQLTIGSSMHTTEWIWRLMATMTHPQLLEGPKCESQVESSEKREGVGACSLTRSTRGGVEGACWSSGIRTRRSDKPYSLTRMCIKPTTKWLVHILEHLGARTSHGQLWTHKTHKTHHDPDSGEATTFPHIVFFAPLHGTCIQMVFYPGTIKEESRNYPGLDSRHFATS